MVLALGLSRNDLTSFRVILKVGWFFFLTKKTYFPSRVCNMLVPWFTMHEFGYHCSKKNPSPSPEVWPKMSIARQKQIMTFYFLRCILATFYTIRFQKQPRFDLPGKEAQPFWGQKQFYCINTLIMADQDYIVFVDVGKKENLVYNDASFVISLLSSTKIWRAKSMHSVLQI